MEREGAVNFLYAARVTDIMRPDGALPPKVLLHFTRRLEKFKVSAVEWDCQTGS